MLFPQKEIERRNIKITIHKILQAKLENNKENITPKNYQNIKTIKREIRNRMENWNH